MELHRAIRDCWKALSTCTEQACGLRSTAIATYANREVRAAIFFPDRTEALIIGFSEKIPSNLPHGQGFRVEVLSGNVPDPEKHWLSIVRDLHGDKEIFATMVEDLRQVLEERQLSVSAFLHRVQAWQNFMEQGRPLGMSEQTEAGCLGEVLILSQLMDYLGEEKALRSWKGPEGGTQDFVFREFALEVKTSCARHSFPASIHSLEQLDEGLVTAPLYLAGVRLRRDAEGVSLTELTDKVTERLTATPALLGLFEALLIRMGYIRGSGMGLRTYTLSSILIYSVTDEFPHFRRSQLPDVFLKASYCIDLDKIVSSAISFSALMESVMKEYCHV